MKNDEMRKENVTVNPTTPPNDEHTAHEEAQHEHKCTCGGNCGCKNGSSCSCGHHHS